jgi:DNA-binding beta-propeller fold protein YncE
VVLALATYAVRQWYVSRIFQGAPLFLIVWREILTACVAAGVVFVLREAVWPVHSIPSLLAQGLVFLLLYAALATLVVGRFVRSIVRQVRAPSADRTDVATVAEPSLPTHATPRTMSFPLGVAYDAAGPNGPALWVTTRDWPAIGRLDLDHDHWTWTETPAYPHLPVPDGRGGCSAALTRSSAAVRVTADGGAQVVPLPKSRELLVATEHRGARWCVDADRRVLVRVDDSTGECTDVLLPSSMERPDFVLATPGGLLWVADTRTATIAEVDPVELGVAPIEGPHPSRFIIADAARAGVWMGASDRGQLTLVDGAGAERIVVPLAATPFGLALTDGGQIVVALRDLDVVALVDPDAAAVVGVAGLPPGSRPMGVATHGRRCWVACSHSSMVVELDLDLFAAPVTDLDAALAMSR